MVKTDRGNLHLETQVSVCKNIESCVVLNFNYLKLGLMTEIIIFTASYVYLISIATFIGYYFYTKNTKRRQFLILSIFTLPLSYLTGLLASFLYYDPRPFVVLHITPLLKHAADNGFPSDHALLMGTLAAIVTVFNKRVGIFLWVLAILVGAARVRAAVHHTIDILASFGIAICATIVVYAILKRYVFRRETSGPIRESMERPS